MAKKTKKRNKACDGKKKYDTLDQAKQAMNMLIRQKDKQGKAVVTVLRAYGCSCGKFHFGRTKKINWGKV